MQSQSRQRERVALFAAFNRPLDPCRKNDSECGENEGGKKEEEDEVDSAAPKASKVVEVEMVEKNAKGGDGDGELLSPKSGDANPDSIVTAATTTANDPGDETDPEEESKNMIPNPLEATPSPRKDGRITPTTYVLQQFLSLAIMDLRLLQLLTRWTPPIRW